MDTSRYDELRHPGVRRKYVCARCPFQTARVDRWHHHVDTVHAEDVIDAEERSEPRDFRDPHLIDPEERSSPREHRDPHLIDPASRRKPRPLSGAEENLIVDRRKARPRPLPSNAVIDPSTRRKPRENERPGSKRFSPEKLRKRR